MSRPVKKLELTSSEKSDLDKGYKEGKSHCLRQRCQMVLLKAEGYASKEIGAIVDSCQVSVNSWVKRFKEEGVAGLSTKEGRGRKPVLTLDHLPMVKAAVGQERQRLSQAQLLIEQSRGRQMSKRTLSRFLKLITAVTEE
jgi:transposase